MKKYFVFLAFLVLSACQSFETGGPANGNCPQGHYDNGSGLCRPLNSMSQDELVSAKQNSETDPNSSPASRKETQAMIDKIMATRRTQPASTIASSSTAKYEPAVPNLGGRTTPMSGVVPFENAEFKSFFGSR
jgi:hypothetical protein